MNTSTSPAVSPRGPDPAAAVRILPVAVPVALAVGGMTCAACVARLERVLARREGVEAVAVNLTAERADLVIDPARIGIDDLVAAITGAGFSAAPLDDAAGGEDSPVSAAENRRALLTLITAALLTLPLVLDMGLGLVEGAPRIPGFWQALLATPVQFWAGARFYRGAWHALKTGGANMDVLIALGSSAAYGLSLYLLLSSGHPPVLAEHAAPAHSGHLYFETAAVVITLVLLGKSLEARARRATRQAMNALLALRPDTACRLTATGEEETVAVSALRKGDQVMVRPGERLPADGILEQGWAAIDESLLTGESLPQERGPGQAVTGGSLNRDGCLRLRITATGAEAALGRMVALVGQAQASKPRIQRLADTVSGQFAFFVAGVALLTLAGWRLLGGAGWEEAILPAVAVLVVACPCALGLATPAVIAVALGVGARHGILIRDAEALENAPRITTVLFDKTGTLTIDRPELTAIHPLADDAATLLAAAAAIQQGSSHPLARAIGEQAAAQGLILSAVQDFRAVAGRGICGRLAAGFFVLGNRAFLQEQGVDCSPGETVAAGWEAQGQGVIWISRDGVLYGLMAVADQIRPQAAAAVAALRQQGIRVVMLTGDSTAAAQAVAARLGITDVVANARPEDKIAAVRHWLAAGEAVAMVGDGINDGPALAHATLGIAMGGGTDVAMQAAAVGLLRDDPALVPAVLSLARATRRHIFQNLGWAFLFNAVAIPLAALGSLPPMLAAAGMTASSLLVVSNALRLGRWRAANPAGPETATAAKA